MQYVPFFPIPNVSGVRIENHSSLPLLTFVTIVVVGIAWLVVNYMKEDKINDKG